MNLKKYDIFRKYDKNYNDNRLKIRYFYNEYFIVEIYIFSYSYIVDKQFMERDITLNECDVINIY